MSLNMNVLFLPQNLQPSSFIMVPPPALHLSLHLSTIPSFFFHPSIPPHEAENCFHQPEFAASRPVCLSLLCSFSHCSVLQMLSLKLCVSGGFLRDARSRRKPTTRRCSPRTKRRCFFSHVSSRIPNRRETENPQSSERADLETFWTLFLQGAARDSVELTARPLEETAGASLHTFLRPSVCGADLSLCRSDVRCLV